MTMSNIVGRAKSLWKRRRAKIKIFIEIIGLLSMFAFGLVLNYLTIWQWYAPENTILLRWNFFGEAFIEYVLAMIVLPCVLYAFKVNVERLATKLWGYSN